MFHHLDSFGLGQQSMRPRFHRSPHLEAGAPVEHSRTCSKVVNFNRCQHVSTSMPIVCETGRMSTMSTKMSTNMSTDSKIVETGFQKLDNLPVWVVRNSQQSFNNHQFVSKVRLCQVNFRLWGHPRECSHETLPTVPAVPTYWHS